MIDETVINQRGRGCSMASGGDPQRGKEGPLEPVEEPAVSHLLWSHVEISSDNKRQVCMLDKSPYLL